MAIDGIYPGKNSVSYTVQFCQRMKSDLFVLQVIDPVRYTSKWFRYLGLRLQLIHRFLEDSLAAGALAEAGADNLARQYLQEGERQLKFLLQESEKAGISSRVFQKVGFADAEIRKCLQSDIGIFLTFYDPGAEKIGRRKRAKLKLLDKKPILDSGVPLVVLR